MTTAFIILYVIGSLSALILCIFLAFIGGRTPRPSEWFVGALLVLFWPIAIPLYIIFFFL